MAVITTRPTYAPAPEGGNSYKITFPIEQVRLYAYFFFVTLCGLAIILFKILVKPLIEAGAPEGTPIERLGCGYFNRDSDPAKSYYGMTKFGLDFGEGFDLDTSHLTELFGFTNVCVYWDYEPARQIVAMYFPLFEYSLAIYVFLDFINTMLSYKRGELPEWYWTLVKCVTPFNILLIAWFRMIFVFVAYNQPHFHSGAFLGMQIALFSVAVTNTWYVLLTKQSYPTIGLSKGNTALLAHTYLICNVAVSAVKMYSTAYIVKNIHGPPYYLYATPIPGMCLGQVIDMFWMIFNAIIPIFVSYTRRNNENPLTVKFSVPTPFYDGDEPEPEDVEPTESTSLLQPATPEEPEKTSPIEPAKTVGPISLGTYRIKTTVHEASGCPAGWGLSAWRNNNGDRDSVSTWVAAHDGDIWPSQWEIKKGRVEGTYRIETKPHARSQHPGGWGLCSYPGIDGARDTVSARVSVHADPQWPMDWKIIPGRTKGTYQLLTTEHTEGGQKAGWGLSAWGPKVPDTLRNVRSSWVHVHEADVWLMDWNLEKEEES